MLKTIINQRVLNGLPGLQVVLVTVGLEGAIGVNDLHEAWEPYNASVQCHGQEQIPQILLANWRKKRATSQCIIGESYILLGPSATAATARARQAACFSPHERNQSVTYPLVN